MLSGFQFAQRIAFTPETAAEVLHAIPALPGVFALRGERASDEPYLTRAADLRRRMTRLLAPPDSQSKRLNLRERVRTIEYTVTGSEFESLLVLYDALAAQFGAAEARRRMRLHTPYCLRLTMEHAHPRVYATNRLSARRDGRGLAQTYGPFPSRLAAERYCDAVLDLFKLRRCHEDLQVHPDHPGCAYGEMKRCMAPCNTSCTGEEYAGEAKAVEAFFRTRGESMLAGIAAERDAASSDMDFERAAALHEQYGKVKAAAMQADEIVGPVAELRALVVQKSAEPGDRASLFLLEDGCLAGPVTLSTLGVRAVKEQTSVGSSLFAQPLMLAPVPLEGEPVEAQESPEARAAAAIEMLRARTSGERDLLRMGDHLSLFRRWYFRPEKQRAGEVFLPNADGSWPVRRILNGAARAALGDPKTMAATDREGAAALKTKILHEGREGVERVVPVVAKRGRRGRVPTPAEVATGVE